MDQVKESKCKSALFAVGGFVVGAAAMGILLRNPNPVGNDERELLRGSTKQSLPSKTHCSELFFEGQPDLVAPSPAPTAELSRPNVYKSFIPNSTVASMTNSFNGSGMRNSPSKTPTQLPTASAPSSSNTTDTLVRSNKWSTSLPTPELPTDLPTYNPTGDQNFPTDGPTKDDGFTELHQNSLFRSNINLNKGKKTKSPALFENTSQNEDEFRLKMYWEEGFYWQEDVNEKWWCMACENYDCQKDGKLMLTSCKNTDKSRDAKFSAVSHGNNGEQYKLAGTNLCIQKMGDRRAIKLKPCNANKRLQRFIGVDGNKDYENRSSFDIRPIDFSDRCLSQHHHPKANETIYAETCKKAHRVDTGYWVKY